MDPAALYAEHRDDVLRFLRGRGAGDDAEDLCQEVFVRVLRAPYVERGNMRGWLRTVAVHILIDLRRQQARRPTLLVEDITPFSQGAEDPELLALPERLAVAAALPALSPIYRAICAAVGRDEGTMEMQRWMRCPAGTVKSRKSRALHTLRERLEAS